MSRMVFCKKLQTQAEGLDYAPYPGELGKKIYEHVSKQAWQMWQQHQTMLINEYRLNLLDSQAREFLEREMQNFFFGEGSAKPPGYQPTEE